jgi:hypothetical protein
MAELPAYPARFDFGRLFADASRVFARAGMVIALGVLVLGALPVTVCALPWWYGSANTPADGLRRIWTVVTIAKSLITTLGYSAQSVLVVAASLKVLTGASWREMVTGRRLVGGFVTSLCLNLIVTSASPAGAFVVFLPPRANVGWILALTARVAFILAMAYAGVAVAAAVAEQRFLVASIGRSIRLLRGLRWRVVGLSLCYLMVLAVAEYGIALALSLARISYWVPGFGLAVLDLVSLLVGVLADVVFVSFFLQARRIADGPTAQELHEVFA